MYVELGAFGRSRRGGWRGDRKSSLSPCQADGAGSVKVSDRRSEQPEQVPVQAPIGIGSAV